MSGESSNFYVTGGTLRHDAPSYVERQADRDLLEALRRGELCYVLTSRQMGKSSLMVRAAARFREEGAHVVVLDLTAIGQNLTPEQWYDGLLVRIGRQLELEEELEEHWQQHLRLSPVQRLFATIRDVALACKPGPHVVFIDEIDMVRSLPFSTDEFFAAIRECHNRRTEDAEMNRLTFCLLGVATPSDLVRDTRVTPFNIGRRIELSDFLPAEARALTKGLVSPADGALPAQDILDRLLFWTHGHPYLTQRLCLAVAQLNGQADTALRDQAEVDLLCQELFFGERARERDDNLLFVRGRLLRPDVDRAGLLQLYEEVLKGRPVRDDERDPLVSVLRLAGIVRLEAGRLVPRNRIYEGVFDRAWVRAQMPDAELARQKAAFYRGVIRTTAIAAVVVAALFVAAVFAVRQAAKAERSLAASHFTRAQLIRKSSLAGQRLESLSALGEARHRHTNGAAVRDGALASLALVDLREASHEFPRLPGGKPAELSADLEVSAEAEDGGAINVRRLRDGKQLASLPALDPDWRVGPLRFGPKDFVLAAEYHGTSQTQLVVWNWKAGRKLLQLSCGSLGPVLTFSAEGRKLAVGDPEGIVRVFGLPDGELKQTFNLVLDSREPRPPQAMRFNPSGDLLAVCSKDDQYLEVWNVEAAKIKARLPHAGVVEDLAWHPTGQLLAAACEDSKIYLWETSTYQNHRKLAGHEGRVTAVDFNPQGTLLASLGDDETVRLWIPATERQMAQDLGRESFDRLRFGANGRRLIASDSDSPRNRVWEVCGGELTVLQAGTGGGIEVRSIDFSPNSQWFLAANGRRITIWEAATGKELEAIPLPNVLAAGFAGDSRSVVASSDRGLFKWELSREDTNSRTSLRASEALRLVRVPASAKNLARLEWTTNAGLISKEKTLTELGMMTVSRDRSTAAVVHKNELLLVPLESQDAARLQRRDLGVHHPLLALHPNVDWLASHTGDSNMLCLWNLSAPIDAFVPSPMPIPGSIYFAFSPDGQWLATCWTGDFRFYRVGAWEEPASVVPRLRASDQHAPMAFARDGRTVALAASRYIIQLHRLPGSGRGEAVRIATLENPDRIPLEMLAFSPDGRFLAAATDRQIVLLWNLAALGEGLASLGLGRDWPGAP